MYRFKPLEFKKHLVKGTSHPPARLHSLIHSDGNNLYIFNGIDYFCPRDGNQEVFSRKRWDFLDLWAYNVSSQQWSLLMDKNALNLSDDPADHILGTMYEKNLLIFCIFEGSTLDRTCFRDLKTSFNLCDLNNKSVVVHNTIGNQVVTFPAASNMIRHGKFLYTIKIANYQGTNFDVFEINTETLEWKNVHKCSLDNEAYSSHYLSTLVYDGKSIFVFGGHYCDETTFIPLIKVPQFDLQKLTWKMLDTHGDDSHTSHFPERRTEFSIAQYRDPETGDINVIITGGIKRIARKMTNDDIHHDIWKLNLTSLKWKHLGPMPLEIAYKHSSTVTSDGQLFIFGGVVFDSENKQSCSSEVYSTWLIVPKLEVICWQAVLHYYPNLASKTKEEVLSLGISWKIFQSRVK